MLFLTLMTASGCLSLATGRSTTASNLLVICALGVGQGGENGCRALLVDERIQEWRKRLVGLLSR
jgi:hypothetical protein